MFPSRPQAEKSSHALTSIVQVKRDCVSEIFYESLLCPANSGYDASCIDTTDNCINARCKCLDGYEIYNGACVTACGVGYQRNNSTGQCEATSTNAQSL